MRQEWTATVLTAEMAEERVQKITTALTTAGWTTVRHLADVPSIDALYTVDQYEGEVMGRIVESSGKVTEWTNKFDLHLSPLLAGSQMILFMDRVAGESAFELIPVLQATKERKEFAICLLTEGVRAQSSIYASFLNGVEQYLMLTNSLENFAQQFLMVRKNLETP